MACDIYRVAVLDVVSGREARLRLAEALSHVEQCAECQAAFADFDRIAAELQPQHDHLSAEPTNGWDAFDEQLMNVSAGKALVDERKNPAVCSFRSIRRVLTHSIAMVSFGAVAACWIGQKFALNHASQHSISSVGNAGQGGIDPVQLADYTTAFAKVSEVFDRRAGWMLVSDSAGTDSSSNMGFSARSLKSYRNVVVLRLNMFQGPATVAISSVDLVIVPGEAADLTVQLAPGQSVHYRVGTSSGDEGHLNLLAEIKTPAGDLPLAALSTTLEMKHDGQISVGELQTSAGRYELRSAFSRATLPAAL